MAYTEYRNNSEHAKHLRKQAGKYLKTLRESRDLTQNDLAKLLGLDYYTFISQVENGFARVPPENIAKWAQALRVDVAEFAMNLLKFYDPFMHAALNTKKKGHT